jgi:hypothetical protein
MNREKPAAAPVKGGLKDLNPGLPENNNRMDQDRNNKDKNNKDIHIEMDPG